MEKVELIERRLLPVRILFYLGVILPLPFICVKALWDGLAIHVISLVDVLVFMIIFPISVFLAIKLFKFSFRLVESPVHFR